MQQKRVKDLIMENMFGLMTIKDFSNELKVPRQTVYSWRREGKIPSSCFKSIGGTLYVKIKNMQEWLDKDT